MIRPALALAASLLLVPQLALAAPRILVPVPDVRQATAYTCGPAALQAVLMYWGIQAREDELAEQMHCNPADGANRHALIQVARHYGLKATPVRPMSRKQLQGFLDRRIPVILAIQAWQDATKPYLDDWEDGHYVVAIGYDARRLYLEEPAILGSRGFLSWLELDERWHDCDASPSDRYERFGVALEGKSAPPRPALTHVD